MERIVIRNTLWLFVGQSVGRALRALLLIYAARALGASSWGAFSYALGIATFFTLFSDIGVNALLVREASRNPELRSRYLSTAFFIKLSLVLALAAGALLLAPIFGRIPESGLLMPLMMGVFVADSLRDLGISLARALEEMRRESVANIVTNGAILAFAALFFAKNATSFNLALAYLLGTIAGLVFIAFSLRAHLANLFRHFASSLVRPILVSAWPFGLMGLMGVAMINTDVVLVGWLLSPEAVGFYSAAQRPIQFFYLIPTLISTAFFPALARLSRDLGRFRELFEEGLALLVMLSLPIALAGAILAREIMLLLYGAEYLPGVASFFILSLTLIAVFPSSLVAHALFVNGERRGFLLYVFAGIAGNALLDLLFIPRFGIAGSAFATLLNQIIVNAFAWRLLSDSLAFTLAPRLSRIVPAAIMFAASAVMLNRLGAHVLVTLGLSLVLYCMLLFALEEPLVRSMARLMRESA
ncbi:MAG: flippase [Candidatus Colwellbacteria bacterium]|nr:flippase [Candidatus Colwellbacteria bacterium]